MSCFCVSFCDNQEQSVEKAKKNLTFSDKTNTPAISVSPRDRFLTQEFFVVIGQLDYELYGRFKSFMALQVLFGFTD